MMPQREDPGHEHLHTLGTQFAVCTDARVTSVVQKERVAGSAFGALLPRHRLTAGLSQEDLAEPKTLSTAKRSALGSSGGCRTQPRLRGCRVRDVDPMRAVVGARSSRRAAHRRTRTDLRGRCAIAASDGALSLRARSVPPKRSRSVRPRYFCASMFSARSIPTLPRRLVRWRRPSSARRERRRNFARRSSASAMPVVRKAASQIHCAGKPR